MVVVRSRFCNFSPQQRSPQNPSGRAYLKILHAPPPCVQALQGALAVRSRTLVKGFARLATQCASRELSELVPGLVVDGGNNNPRSRNSADGPTGFAAKDEACAT